MKTHKENKKGLWAIMHPIKLEIRIAMLLAALGALSLIATLVILSYTLTHILQKEPFVFFGITLTLTNTIILLAILTVIAFLSRLSSFIVSHLGAFRLEQILRTQLAQHLSQVPLGYVISTGSGSLKKVMQTDVKSLHAFVADSTPMIAKSIIAPLVTLLTLLWIDYRLAFASIAVLVVGWIAMGYAMKDSTQLRQKYEQSQANISRAVIEFAQAMPVVRTFDDGSTSFKRYNEALDAYKQNLNKWMALSATPAKLGAVILSPLPTLLCVLLTSIILLHYNSLSLFAFISALFLSTGMAESMMPLMWLNNHIKKSQASALRIQEILEVKELEQTNNSTLPQQYDVQFHDVSFQYKNIDNYALENIDLIAQQNQVTALVGPSGAGKSTVAKLIPRFWDVTKGEITIGGVNIKNMSAQDLMNTVSFVFQDTFLFQDTLLNNIKIANLQASKEEIIQAAKAAQIHDFITTLPHQYETMAGDRGTNLSGGQKQRITIARAILRNTPIVILDEATAFADPENEEEIVKALANLTKNKTVIMIAHRLSTIKNADMIIVFNEGHIQERGKHEELIVSKGVYSTLWQNYLKASEWNLIKGANHA
jgi:ATP-binding cassette subfamily B protein